MSNSFFFVSSVAKKQNSVDATESAVATPATNAIEPHKSTPPPNCDTLNATGLEADSKPTAKAIPPLLENSPFSSSALPSSSVSPKPKVQPQAVNGAPSYGFVTQQPGQVILQQPQPMMMQPQQPYMMQQQFCQPPFPMQQQPMMAQSIFPYGMNGMMPMNTMPMNTIPMNSTPMNNMPMNGLVAPMTMTMQPNMAHQQPFQFMGQSPMDASSSNHEKKKKD